MKKVISFIKKNSWIELIVIFFIVFIMNYKFLELTLDEIWNYGFSLNIAKGMIPYRDFNMIITPLFPIIHGIFMFLFGKNMVIFHLVNSLIFMLSFYYLKKLFPKSYYLLTILIISISLSYTWITSTYNYLSFALLLIIMYLEEKKEKKYDFIIGILIGLILITKQNIGVLVFMPSLFIIKEFKRFFIRILGIITPVILILIYLIMNEALYEFIDYTILGLMDFKNNMFFTPHVIAFIFVILFCLYEIFNKKNKSMMIKYLFFFNLMAYPLFDGSHIFLPFVISLGCIFNKLKLDKKIITYTFYVIISLIFCYKVFLCELIYINNNNYLKGRLLINKDTFNYTQSVVKNINEYPNDYKIYIFDEYAYLIKLYSNMDLNKYDLINNGNMGYQGATRYIREFDEECALRKCLFVLENKLEKNDQTSAKIINYVKENYQYKEDIYNYSVYTNDFEIK